MVFMVSDSLGIKNHKFLHGVHGLSIPDNKNHTFLNGFHGFSIPGNKKPYVFYMVFMVFQHLRPYCTNHPDRTGPDRNRFGRLIHKVADVQKL